MRGSDRTAPMQPPRAVAAVVLLAVVAAYGASLGGGWVWDDLEWALGPVDWHLLLVGERALIFRPLAGAAIGVVQALSAEAWVQRSVGLLLHLGAVALVAGIARGLGARASVAWFGAACFGLHPAMVEVVAWASCRSESVPSLLTLGAWLALVRGRPILAGGLLAAAPFAKEAWLVGPACVALWTIGTRRPAWTTVAIATLGSLAYLGVRHAVGFPFPMAPGRVNLPEAVGAFAARGAEVLLFPASADVFAPYVPHGALGIVVIGVGALAVVASRGRPALAAALFATPILTADALASATIGVVADRYFYLGVAGLAVALALAVEAVADRRGRVLPLAWALPALLSWPTHLRALEFTDDVRLFGASHALDPDNARAGFAHANALQRAGRCPEADPIYREVLDREPEARAAWMACLGKEGRFDEALALGAGSERPDVRWARANVLVDLERFDEAEASLRADAARYPPSAHRHVLLARLAGRRHAWEASEADFRTALRIDTENADAAEGLRVVEARH